MLTIFLVTCILLPYLIFQLAAWRLSWTDHRVKSASRHVNEICSSVLLGTTIYFVGGYGESFHPFLSPGVVIGTVLGYGILSEYKPLQSSLSQYRSWSWQMWTVTLSTVAVVVGFGVVHVLFAVERWGTMLALGGYLGPFLLLPLLGGILVAGIHSLETTRARDVVADDFELVVGDPDEEEEQQPILSDDDEEQHDGDEGDARRSVERGAALRTLPPRPIRTTGAVKIRRVLKIHLHHYQIFAYLAIFTRFPTIWSRVAAGLALGCMMHGIAAYGVDSLFEYEEDSP